MYSSNDWDPVCLHNKLLENVISLQALTIHQVTLPPLKTSEIKIHM